MDPDEVTIRFEGELMTITELQQEAMEAFKIGKVHTEIVSTYEGTVQ